MGIRKFMESIESSLVLKDSKEEEDKKKSTKALINKLNRRKESITQSLASFENKDLKEELQIISLLIKKGNNLLDNLSS